MSDGFNPYRGLPSYQYWRTGVTDIGPGQFDPVGEVKFKIDRNDRVSTLGSCFAQHLAKHISKSGYNYWVAEPLNPDEETSAITSAMANQFSARYGNVYTVRQALQLLNRSGGWEPKNDIWERDGRFFDAFRPNMFPGGFASKTDLTKARSSHLDRVAEIFSNSDVIVFTLGLTEAWISRHDGSVYPLAPGVVAGSMDESDYAFKNFNYDEVRVDLEKWCARLRSLNSEVRILLTISPVALNATYENQNVWTSTTYSKSVLRAAAGDIASKYSYVDYFPSYEIITCPLVQGRYFEDDMREVKEIGVRHVMRVFDKHYLASSENDSKAEPTLNLDYGRTEGISDIFCDEELLDPR
jgi:hypothetical protein